MRAALSLLILALSPLAAHSQTLDCTRAQSSREITICSSTRLSALDAELATSYKSLRAQLSPESAALVESDQNEWLHWLDLICPEHGPGSPASSLAGVEGKGPAEDQPGSPASSLAGAEARCLTNQYFTRVHDLQQVAHLGAAVIFPRAHFLFKPGTAASHIPVDPGFGYGSLRWPQIDKPNAAQSAWNDAVKTRAASRAVNFNREKRPTDSTATFDTAVDASGTIEAYFNIQAANDRFIDVMLTDGTYGWGAAHPLTSRAAFLWWLDRNRELTPADVFLPSSDWQQKLTTLAIANLHSQTDIKNYLAKDLEQPVKQTLSDPTSWTLTRDGLTITFGQYAIGPYVLGMPEAHVRWEDLAPCLEPSLNPSTLPPPEPVQ